MTFVERFGNSNLKIDLGCGTNKTKGFIGIDKVEIPGVDYVYDFEKGLKEIPDNSVMELVSHHVLEHIENLDLLLAELHRVLHPDGFAKIRVPHFSNPHYYSDPTHKRFFGLYTFFYYSDTEDQLKRKVPNFYSPLRFKVTDVRYNIWSTNKFSNIFKQLLKRTVNMSNGMKEYYERSWVWVFPANDVIYTLKKK